MKRAGRPGGVADAGVGDGRRGAGCRNAAALPCPPAFGLSAASALPDCRPLSLYLPDPVVLRADSRRRAGPTAAEAWCWWRRLAPAQCGAGGLGRSREGLEVVGGRPAAQGELGRVATVEAAGHDLDVAAGGLVAVEAVGASAMETARELEEADTITCMRKDAVLAAQGRFAMVSSIYNSPASRARQ